MFVDLALVWNVGRISSVWKVGLIEVVVSHPFHKRGVTCGGRNVLLVWKVGLIGVRGIPPFPQKEAERMGHGMGQLDEG